MSLDSSSKYENKYENYEDFLMNYETEGLETASGLTLDQVKFYIEDYWPKKHNGNVFPREVVLKEGTLKSNKEKIQEAFINNKNNKDFIKYFICVDSSNGNPHSEVAVYGVIDGEKFAITESISRSLDLNDFLNKEKDLKVNVVGIKLQNDYINCGVFCLELAKHLGKNEIKNILQKIKHPLSTDLYRKNYCSVIKNNANKYLPASLVSYKQSLSDEMANFLKMKNDVLKKEDEKEDVNKNTDEDKKNKKEVYETEDQKIARKIICSYGVNNQSKVVKINARANQKRRTIQWYYDKKQNEKNNSSINQSKEKNNCLIF